MNIVVTGSSGFVGQHVVRELVKNNNVTVFTRSKDNISKYDWFKKITHHEINIYKPFDYNEVLDFIPDGLIHLSWQGIPFYKDIKHLNIYYKQNLDFLIASINYGIKNICITGSCLEYGLQEGGLKEMQETSPVTVYGQAKDALRKELEKIDNKQLNLKWIRLFYMYGDGQNEKSLIPQLTKAANDNNITFGISNSEHIRDYMKVEDIAVFLSKAIRYEKINGVINCCSGKPIKLGDFLNQYCKLKNIDIKIKSGLYPENDYEPQSFWGIREKMDRILSNE